MTLFELRKKLAEKRNALKAMQAETRGKQMNEEQRGMYDALLSEMDQLNSNIVDAEVQADTDRILNGELREEAHGLSLPKQKEAEYRKAMDHYLRAQSFADLPENERKALKERRAMNTGTESEGGFLISTDFMTEVVEEKFTWGAFYARARQLRTQRGNPITWPVSTEGLRRGVIIGEGQNHGKADTGFTNKTLGAYKLSSRIILVSDELLQDAYIDIAAYVTRIANQRVELGINYYILNGAGGGTEPEGLKIQIPASKKFKAFIPAKGVAGRAAAIVDALIDLIHSVDPAYRSMPDHGIAMHDFTLAEIQKMKDANGNPIYVKSLTDTMPDTVLGYKLILDNQMPLVGQDGWAIAGCFDFLIVRKAGDMVVRRLNELYAETGQVGFLAWQRFGVVLEDTASFAMIMNAASAGDATSPTNPVNAAPVDNTGDEEGYVALKNSDGDILGTTGVAPAARTASAGGFAAAE